MIDCQREKFDIPDEVAYFNCASISPLMNSARDAGIDAIVRRSHAWELVHPDDWLAPVRRARELFARLIGAEPTDIALAASTSYAIAVAAKNLAIPSGARFVVPASQHESNVFQWRVKAREVGGAVVSVPKPKEGDWTQPILNAIDEATAVVAVPHCDWTDGMLFDLVAIGARAREVGAALVVDGMQSIGVLTFPFVRFVPISLRAARGSGCSGRPIWRSSMWRQNTNRGHHSSITASIAGRFWTSSRNSRDEDMSEEFMPGAERYDVGQRGNFVHLPMAIAAMEQILEWGVTEIAGGIAPLTLEINERARAIGLVPPERGVNATHMTGLRFPGAPPVDVEHRLARSQVHITMRRGLMRVSPHLYNNAADIDRLFEALAEAMRHGAAASAG